MDFRSSIAISRAMHPSQKQSPFLPLSFVEISWHSELVLMESSWLKRSEPLVWAHSTLGNAYFLEADT